MATARSLTGVEWLIRTYANSMLVTCGRATEAGALSGGQTISTNARLAALVGRIEALKTACWADYTPQWDASWQAAVNRIPADVLAQCPIPIGEMMGDPDGNVRVAIRGAFLTVELRACQFLASGGSL
jgi:hypothetical protein